MVKCSFCGKMIPMGTGKILAFNSGDIKYYCSNKCEKNQNKLKRDPKNFKWTEAYRKTKSSK